MIWFRQAAGERGKDGGSHFIFFKELMVQVAKEEAP
jgi:hypothetical protein